MIRPRFSYLKFTAVVALVAITQVPAISTLTAKAQPPADDAGLRNEHRLIGKYLDDLFAYDKQTVELGKRAKLVQTDLDAVDRKAQDLKARLSGVQDAVREIVKKLKAADEWADLDRNLVARITNGRDKAFFQQNSFKKFLEDASNDLASHENEISAPLDNLRKRQTSQARSAYGQAQIVRATYAAPAPVFRTGLKCLMANLQLGLTWRLDGQESTKNQNQRLCACDPSSATCSAT